MSNIKIPIKPHLRKYVLRKLNTQSVVKVSTTDKLGLGIFILQNLIKKKEHFISNISSEDVAFVSSIPTRSFIEFEIGAKYSKEKGVFIENSAIYNINKYIDKFFLNEMFTFVNSLILFDPNIVALYAIDDFISIYDISDDDILLESLYMTYRRHKEKYSYIK